MNWKKVMWLGTAAMVMLTGQGAMAQEETDASQQETVIELSDDGVTVDGTAAGAEGAVYLSNDIIYYEEKETYESGNPYGEGTQEDMHTEEEAAAHTVVNITSSGVYRISGTLSKGQIAVDLGEEAKTDPNAKVTLILDNADITCTVAPAVIFYRTYECDEAWTAYDEGEAESYEASAQQDTSQAGANVVLADGSVNNVTGSYVARIFEDTEDEKKLYKFDGAFYSQTSLNIDGEEAGDGVLNIVADNEGLDSELHLTINGGKVNIQSQDDGINTNEDGVSVTTINGGSVHIMGGLGKEGDGIDSNGYLVINGGTVIATANPASDSGLDSDMGSYINGGTVVATGSTMDWPESDSGQVTMNLQFSGEQSADEALIVTDTDGNVVFAYDPDQDETAGEHNRGYQGAVISSENFEAGADYHVYVGGEVSGEETDGLYDVQTVTGFENAVQQEYTGSQLGGFGGRGGFGGGMMRMEQILSVDGISLEISEQAAQEILQLLQQDGAQTEVTQEELTACTSAQELMTLLGMNREKMPEPDGEDMQRPGEEGMQAPDEEPQKPEPDEENQQTADGEGEQASSVFHMEDKVNAFAQVQDMTA